MKVVRVKDGMKIEPNTVHVIPPAYYMSVIDGHLTLSSKGKSGKHPDIIDHFLTALAPVYQNNAVAVILSGAGSDGTLGVQAIKAHGGITFAQDSSAMFHTMAQSAATSGYVDFVLPPKNIAKELAALIKHPYAITAPVDSLSDKEKEIKTIHVLLHNKFGVDFSHYKHTTINRRIMRRMALNRQANLEEYIKYLRKNAEELDLLYKDLLINVTSFFREPALYQMLSKKIFPVLFKNKKASEPIRIWIPACSTGEEACTLAICLFEYLGDKAISTPIQIFATDLSEPAIEKARQGIYNKNSLQNMSPQRLNRFFVKVDGSYQIIKPIRDVCIFATHNLLKDPPFSRMDMISCQNVMIYLESNPQRKILQAFHYALKNDGYLVLGKSETTGNDTDLFLSVDKEHKIFTKKASSANAHFDFSLRTQSAAPASSKALKMPQAASPEVDIEKEADKLLLSRYVHASVLVNKDMQILRFCGPMSAYLQPAAGKASLHLLKMVRDELVFELRSLIHRAKKEGHTVKKENVHLTPQETVSIDVVPIKSTIDQYYLIVFKAGPQAIEYITRETGGAKNESKDRRITILEQEIREAREHMKSMSEEFEATREELQSANEEVLSSNEELQSINEELETSKEELQSTNEELTTINEELQQRNTDLKEAVEYSLAIVETINEPLVVLNADLRVRTANKAFYNTFKSQPDDTEGYYFYELGMGQWNIPELKKSLKEIISQNKAITNMEISGNFPNIGEKTLMIQAIRMDHEDNRKNRILLVIEDITQRKKSEREIQESEERLRIAMQAGHMGTWDWNLKTNEVLWSQEHNRMFGLPVNERVGSYKRFLQAVHEGDRDMIAAALRQAMDEKKDFSAEMRAVHKNGSIRWIAGFGRAIYDKSGKPNRMIGVMLDITEGKEMAKMKEEFIGIASHELKTPVTSIKSYVELLHDMVKERKDKTATELAEKLDKQVDRLSNLIKDLLDVTRINQGQMLLRKSSFDINKLIEETTEELQQTTGQHTIEKQLGKARQVRADKERITQVLNNLISNAIKYSPSADKIIINTNADTEKVTVRIQDFGIGLPQTMHEKIFEPYLRLTAADSSNSGLGLGLFIAANIIKRHGGTIWVESKKGKGSVFCFTIPYKKQ